MNFLLNQFQKIFINKEKQIINDLADKIQNLINDLYAKDPDNETFDQAGMLNGLFFVKDYLNEGEYGLAIEHLLYMVYESDISYPNEIIEELNKLVSKYKIENPYA